MAKETDIQVILQAAEPNQEHEWIMGSAKVAEGYGISASTLRTHKQTAADELLEGTHWIKSGQKTLWTKRGVIQLGFKVQSKRGADFRAMAEQIVFEATAPKSVPALVDGSQELTSVPTENIPLNFDTLAQSIALKLAPTIQHTVLEQRVKHHLQTALLKDLENVGQALGKSIGTMYGIDLSAEITEEITRFQSEVRA